MSRKPRSPDRFCNSHNATWLQSKYHIQSGFSLAIIPNVMKGHWAMSLLWPRTTQATMWSWSRSMEGENTKPQSEEGGVILTLVQGRVGLGQGKTPKVISKVEVGRSEPDFVAVPLRFHLVDVKPLEGAIRHPTCVNAGGSVHRASPIEVEVYLANQSTPPRSSVLFVKRLPMTRILQFFKLPCWDEEMHFSFTLHRQAACQYALSY